MAWVLLLVAGLFEVGWAVGLKYTHGFTRFWPSLATGAALVASMTLLGLVVRTLPLGTSYALWTGIGILGTAALGTLLFDEAMTPMKVLCIVLIVAGILGLKLAG